MFVTVLELVKGIRADNLLFKLAVNRILSLFKS